MERCLDVSDLEAPEPLMRTLAEVAGLRDGEYLRMVHRREPLLLYENLESKGFAHITRGGEGEACQVFIWREDDAGAGAEVRAVAEQLPAWEE
jgi:hypothetical protein